MQKAVSGICRATNWTIVSQQFLGDSAQFHAHPLTVRAGQCTYVDSLVSAVEMFVFCLYPTSSAISFVQSSGQCTVLFSFVFFFSFHISSSCMLFICANVVLRNCSGDISGVTRNWMGIFVLCIWILMSENKFVKFWKLGLLFLLSYFRGSGH